LAALAGGLTLFQQRARLGALHTQVEKLEATKASARANPPAVPAQPASGDGLSEPDKLELLRLRAEVTRLRARQQELAPLRAENQALREQVRQKSPPPGYRRMQDVQFAGQATPEAALQSFIWAMGKGDTNALCQVLTEEAAEDLMNDPHQRRQRELFAAARIIPGYRLVEAQPRSTTEIALKVELLPGEATQEIIVRLQDGRWRMTF
jgi:hypothetical protein